jgi:hypothetical protein
VTRYLLALSLFAFLAVGATPEHVQCFLQQQERPIDRVGPEDPAHEGQPRSCSNREAIDAASHTCSCHKALKCEKPEAEPRDCQTFCRPSFCRCRPKHCETI